MKRVALVFLLAVFVPSIVLAFLALRSLRDQQVVIERQQSSLCQTQADSASRAVNDSISLRQREFDEQVESFLNDPAQARDPSAFDSYLTARWPFAEVGFVISRDNQILSPAASARPETRQFLVENGRFLTNRESVTVFNIAAKNAAASQQAIDEPGRQSPQQALSNSLNNAVSGKLLRVVKPQSEIDPADAERSKLESTEAEFRQLSRDSDAGAIARFLQNKLNVLFWHRSIRDPALIFGVQVRLAKLVGALSDIIRAEEKSPYRGIDLTASRGNEICLALLDDTGRPAETSIPGFHANWKSPFVATEIGEVLPHWEIAVYLVDPGKITRSVRSLQWTLALLVAALVAAISAGGWSIVSDLRRELTLARQKTDFVSNVSHELKTPLTSIRMFSELLAEGRVADEAKRVSYLQIISAEAARLTRLINNVLDFARLERGGKKYRFHECDAANVVREAVDSYRPHLEGTGFTIECDLPNLPLMTRGDEDALAQVVVNLISNAEKYSDAWKEIRIEADRADSWIEVRVMDRGLGVPAGCEAMIFEKFFRAHDGLSSGVQGSGLGLTLAHQIATAHGGDLTYRPRQGGGSCFTLQLPSSES